MAATVKLDLACGRNPTDGYEGVDSRKLPGVKHVVDLTVYPWPWADDSVEAILCSHYVEHVADLVAFMNECGRILQPGGRLTIAHPYQHSDRAWQDPTHVRALNMVSWAYYDADSDIRKAMGDEYGSITCDFEIVNLDAILNPRVAMAYPDGVPTEILAHSVNVIDDLVVTMVKRAKVNWTHELEYGMALLDHEAL